MRDFFEIVEIFILFSAVAGGINAKAGKGVGIVVCSKESSS